MKPKFVAVFFMMWIKFCVSLPYGYPQPPYGGGYGHGYPVGCGMAGYPGYSFIGWPEFGLGANMGRCNGYPNSFIGTPTFGLVAGGGMGYPGIYGGNYYPYPSAGGFQGPGTGLSNSQSASNSYGGLGGGSSTALGLNLGGLFG